MVCGKKRRQERAKKGAKGCTKAVFGVGKGENIGIVYGMRFLGGKLGRRAPGRGIDPADETMRVNSIFGS
jgi:hypothetical protein